MATLVDAVGALQQSGVYDTVLPFILIFAGLYALLLRYKPLGESKWINGIITFIISLVFITATKAVLFLNLLLPIITIFLVLLVLAILIFTFVGVKAETISETITKHPMVIFFIFLIIVLAVLTVALGPEATLIVQYPEIAEQLGISPTGVPENATVQEQGASFLFLQALRILTSPQVMGMIVLFVVFGLAAYFITREPVGKG